jgi:hypothetical protein
MMLRKYSLFALLLAVPFAPAQTAQTTPVPSTAPVWVTIASEGDVKVVLPAGATYRFGDSVHNLWSVPVTVQAQTTFTTLYYPSDNFPFADPDPGSVKELDVMEASLPQTVTVVNTLNWNSVAQVVPALTAPALSPVSPGGTYTLTFSNFSTPASAGQNALMFAFVNAPANLANITWEGTQMNVTINGVTMVCTYGQTYTTGVFSLACNAAAPTGTATTSGQ